ncbi:MAG: hypothetical protein INR62_07350, partial [Rhodospirillales bacterium]|nr:hypothetical protein [Acetobacter sp.]
MTGIMAPALIMVLAMSIEVTSWSVDKLELQRIADAAAWAGAHQYGATSNAQAATYAAADLAEINGVTSATIRTWSATTLTLQDNLITAQIVSGIKSATDRAVKVTVQRVVNKTFSLIFPSSSTSVTLSAIAIAEVIPVPASASACVVALNASTDKAIRVDNMGSIIANNCSIASNSSAADAVYLDSGTIKGTAISAVGGIVHSNSGSNTLSPSPGSSY